MKKQKVPCPVWDDVVRGGQPSRLENGIREAIEALQEMQDHDVVGILDAENTLGFNLLTGIATNLEASGYEQDALRSLDELRDDIADVQTQITFLRACHALLAVLRAGDLSDDARMGDKQRATQSRKAKLVNIRNKRTQTSRKERDEIIVNNYMTTKLNANAFYSHYANLYGLTKAAVIKILKKHKALPQR